MPLTMGFVTFMALLTRTLLEYLTPVPIIFSPSFSESLMVETLHGYLKLVFNDQRFMVIVSDILCSHLGGVKYQQDVPVSESDHVTSHRAGDALSPRHIRCILYGHCRGWLTCAVYQQYIFTYLHRKLLLLQPQRFYM